MRIRVEKEKCSGCHLCEMVCSFFQLGRINTDKSAIRIQKDDLDSGLNTPVLCRQCQEMKCLGKEGVTEDQEKRKYIWERKRMEGCPFQALTVLGETAYHCNLCGGNPQCVKVCSPGAITLIK